MSSKPTLYCHELKYDEEKFVNNLPSSPIHDPEEHIVVKFCGSWFDVVDESGRWKRIVVVVERKMRVGQVGAANSC